MAGLAALAAALLLGGGGGRTASSAELEEAFARWVDRLPGRTLAGVRRALELGDRESALAFTRAASADARGGAATLLVEAHLGLDLHEALPPLEALERAVAVRPEVAEDPLFVADAIQTFLAGRRARTEALLRWIPSRAAIPYLRQASTDWSYRIRHGAIEELRRRGAPQPDEIAVALLDIRQLDRCDSRRALAVKLVAKREADERLPVALDELARRSSGDSCLADVIAVRDARAR